jgi:hypothetical protein
MYGEEAVFLSRTFSVRKLSSHEKKQVERLLSVMLRGNTVLRKNEGETEVKCFINRFERPKVNRGEKVEMGIMVM